MMCVGVGETCVRAGRYYTINMGNGELCYGQCALASEDSETERLTYLELEWDGWIACIDIPTGWYLLSEAGSAPELPDMYRKARERGDTEHVRWVRTNSPSAEEDERTADDPLFREGDRVQDARHPERLGTVTLTDEDGEPLVTWDDEPHMVQQEHFSTVAPSLNSGEVRVTSETGASKGSKLARWDLIPQDALWELAEHYGKGAEKYDAVGQLDNWRAAYPWSLSFAAAFRHMSLALSGVDVDEENGSKHVIAAAWHMLTLAHYMNVPEFCAQYDDRQDKMERDMRA